MSVLGKYRREAERESDASTSVERKESKREATPSSRQASPTVESVPNKDRKSPIVSFSIPSDLRRCLQAIRRTKSINLSMWVEKHLREAVVQEFPSIAERFLEPEAHD
ncbi:MAG: hypothetical protein QXQ81_06070 [Candidatus Thorarchaeota archaeon]